MEDAKDIRIIKPKLYDFEKFTERAKQIFDTGWFTNNGPFLRDFESRVSSYLGVNSLAVCNGTMALKIILKRLKLKGNVILPSFTFCATGHAVDWAGLTPNFVDIDPKTYNLDPERVREAINEDTCAILAVHVFGNPCDIEQLSAIAKEYNIPLIFDAAHAFGSKYDNQLIGRFGDAEAFSTHATKIFNTVEGGLITTNNPELLERLNFSRNFGFANSQIDTSYIGSNAKMSELHAIVGLDSIEHIDTTMNKRNEIIQQYLRDLENIPGISFQKVDSRAKSNYFYFTILVDEKEYGVNRDKLAEIMEASGIQVRKYFYLPLHQQTAYKNYAGLSLPNTEYVANNILCLPTHTELNKEDVEEVCRVIRDNRINTPESNTSESNILEEGMVENVSELSSNSSREINSVLVTGGAGYVGCVLVKKLLEQGYKVKIVDQLIFGKEPLNEFINHENFELIVGLIEDKYTLEKSLKGVDAIIHLAGLSNDPSCEINSDLTRKVNVDATKFLLEEAKKQKVKRFIYASSCSVYGFTGDEVVTEESKINPLTAYAKSKIDCEEIIFPYSSDFMTVCLRKSTIYGPSSRMRFDLVVNTMTGMAVTENKILINGGEQWRPFIHVEDVADAYVFMLEVDKEKVNGQVFNLGSNEQNIKILDLAYRIAAQLPGVKVEKSESPDRRSYHASFDKLTSLGWKTKLSIEDGVLGVKKLFDDKIITDFRDLNHFNIKRMITYLNI